MDIDVIEAPSLVIVVFFIGSYSIAIGKGGAPSSHRFGCGQLTRAAHDVFP
jgi:hypothetical protein